MCFKFLRNGARGCNKLDCTYAHPKMCRIALTTGRCARKNCFYCHKTGTIRPVLSKPTQGPTKPTIPLMELALPIPVPPSFITRIPLLISHMPKKTGGICPLPPPQKPYPQSHPINNYQHYVTQRPTTETITPQDSPSFHSATYPLLDQMKVIKQLMLDMQQAQSKLLQTMNQA